MTTNNDGVLTEELENTMAEALPAESDEGCPELPEETDEIILPEEGGADTTDTDDESVNIQADDASQTEHTEAGSVEEAEAPPTEKVKRKRAAPRKKAGAKESGQPSESALADGQEKEGPEGPGVAEPAETPSAIVPSSVAAPQALANPALSGPQVARRGALAGLDLRELDRDLSDEQRREWNEIYASYRSKSVLTGHIMGVDRDEFRVVNRETGIEENKRMHTVIVIPYRVKVLIPESEMWMPDEDRPGHVLRNMVGSKIDFVVLNLDREGECAIGSRRMAMAARRHLFSSSKVGHEAGKLLTCDVLAVGPRRCLVGCNGYDITLSQRDLTYTTVPDLRERYHSGQELPCVEKEYSRKEDRLVISVKEVNPNPFWGAEERHPINSRRQATISGKYGGGIFCTLPDDTNCLCLYSAQHNDSDFHIGTRLSL